MGPDVDLASVMASLESAHIDTIIKEYEDADKDLLLYAACELNLKLTQNNTQVLFFYVKKLQKPPIS